MKSSSKAVLALAAASLLGLAYAAAQPEAVIHIGHEKVDATFAKGGLLLQTNNYKIMAGRRSGCSLDVGREEFSLMLGVNKS